MASLIVTALCALDARDGLVRVKIDELNGRVTLYRLTAVKGTQYEPLVFDTDARTSSLIASIDGRIQKLGETQEYRIAVRKIQNGAEVEFASQVAVVTQRIVFIRSADSRIFNGFKVTYEVKNLTARDAKARLRQIWDTVQGEKNSVHFSTDTIARVEEEMIIGREGAPYYIASPGESASLMLLLKDVERPDRVVLANWKRLADSTWFYDTLMKGFSLPPYSVNDSAMALYWDDFIIKAGSSKSVACYFLTGGAGLEFTKQVTKNGFAIVGEAAVAPPAAPIQQTQASAAPVQQGQLPAAQGQQAQAAASPGQQVQSPAAPGAETRQKLLLDIEALRKLLGSLDTAIQTADAVTDEQLQSLLSELQAVQPPPAPAESLPVEGQPAKSP
jgi:hypothetical protein